MAGVYFVRDNLVHPLICLLFMFTLPKLKIEASYTEWKNEQLMWTLVCGCVK